jgi:hypothetical protein
MTNQSEDVQSFERRSGTYENSFFQGLFFDRIHRNMLQAVRLDFNPQASWISVEGRAGCSARRQHAGRMPG